MVNLYTIYRLFCQRQVQIHNCTGGCRIYYTQIQIMLYTEIQFLYFILKGITSNFIKYPIRENELLLKGLFELVVNNKNAEIVRYYASEGRSRQGFRWTGPSALLPNLSVLCRSGCRLSNLSTTLFLSFALLWSCWLCLTFYSTLLESDISFEIMTRKLEYTNLLSNIIGLLVLF